MRAVMMCFMTALFLCGCTAAALMAGGGERKAVSLAQSSYGAADMLSQQTQALLTRDSPLTIGAITDLNHPAAQTAFGQTVANQMTARFVQLGYKVSASAYPEISGGAPPGGPAPYDSAYGGYGGGGAPASVASATLTGQYAVAEDDVLVNLRLLDTATQRVLAAYDYSVPLTRDIEKLTEIPGAKKGLFGF